MAENESNGLAIIAKEHVEELLDHPLWYQGVPCVTTEWIDRAHGRDRGVAGHAFRRHRIRFCPKDFFEVPYEDWSKLETVKLTASLEGGYRGDLLLFTERGYLKIVRTFGDDRSWALYELLIDSYFKPKERYFEEHWLRPYIEKTSAALESLQSLPGILNKLESNTSKIQEDVKDLKVVTTEHGKAIAETSQVLNQLVPRRHPTDAAKNRHRNAMMRAGRQKCPCCGKIQVLDQNGHFLSITNWDHWYARNRRDWNEIWPICSTHGDWEGCNQRLERINYKTSRTPQWVAHQQIVEELGEGERPDQMLLWDCL